jgi:hypothetical protein
MKKLILHILVVFLFCSSCAKKEIVAGPDVEQMRRSYEVSRKAVMPYAGTWIGSVNEDTLLVELALDSSFVAGFDLYRTEISGSYTYHSSQYKNESIQDSFIAWFRNSKDSTTFLSAISWDPVYKKGIRLNLKLADGKEALKWSVTNRVNQHFDGPTELDVMLDKAYLNKVWGSHTKWQTQGSYLSSEEAENELRDSTSLKPIVPWVTSAYMKKRRLAKFSIPESLTLSKVE